ncbi:uncharacterized protein MONOS_7274 [Monocercomonoides exilis]|uniref:uncharacterized protein n=1 Tax=Monocercomonoides exilis TaxID=2049356 RepID=UPI00355A4B8F|nr:hypothetical protein MONOS_7274 [Monocercomonoides exilis]|eukprot:MONOS_7274.1-p1 / transcript=MONOS_7274.1 / gene=MONOS_7274 / organism=Monocercomonoides_exilis_PA203 / gene_product=unspecified product / transcript_product=unspecified product / location=Mono_scaffold00244:70732-78885(+) / protein_length=2717 / sequence_SO=supercontig / SO=protein_coding / is_pseudo=false
MNLAVVISAILGSIIYGHCLFEDAANDKVEAIPEMNVLQIIPASGSTTSTKAENSCNVLEINSFTQCKEKSSEYFESEEWEGKWRKNQNNRLESTKTNTNTNNFISEGDLSSENVRNVKKAYEGIEESKMRSLMILINSSVHCMNLGMFANGNTSSITLRAKSAAMISGCYFEVRSEISPFDLCFSQIQLTNLTLRSLKAQQTQMPPLFCTQLRESKGQSASYVSVCSSHFSSFHISSPPFLSSSFVESVSLTDSFFSNISTIPTHRVDPFTLGYGCTTQMNDCSFSSVCDVYDGGIVPSLNNPFASLTASNTSFVECCRTRNIEFIGSKENPLKPGRQNTTDDVVDSFIWCEWNGSKTTGSKADITDDASNGGAIRMYNLENGILFVSYCAFNNCYAFYGGGGIMCRSIKSMHIVNNLFCNCTAQNYNGGGMNAVSISSCTRISGCEFQNCNAKYNGGGLFLEYFQVSAQGCIGDEKGEGESACMFDCSFSLCSLASTGGGGIFCKNMPATQFKMRSIQFISCSATAHGGGLYLEQNKTTAPDDGVYCCFLFFHECKCRDATNPRGHNVQYADAYNLYLSTGNPFYECYTTNADIQRMCYAYDYSSLGSWVLQNTEKKNWLKDGILYRFVAADGGVDDKLCGADELTACQSIGIAVNWSATQTSLVISLLEGNHCNEETEISIESKKMRMAGKGKERSIIETKSLSPSSTTLFRVLSGKLEVFHVGIDHNSERDSSPSVFVVSERSGSLSLEDVLISSSVVETKIMTSSVFVMKLSQLAMTDVEIKNMKVSQPLFAEPSSTEDASDESFLSNVIVRNVNLTEGDGVVVAKSVKSGEAFVVWNITIEQCVCENGNGGGIYVCLTGDGKIAVNGASVIDGNKAENNGGRGGRGGGMFVLMESGGCGLTIGENVEFSKVKENEAEYGKDVFVGCGSGVFLESKVNSNTFAFFDTSEIPSDVLRLSGSENGDESGVIPLFVYLCTMGTKVIVDGSGGNGMDHNHCGFEGFGCLTVDYCVNSRMSESSKEIEVISSSSINEEIEFSSFDVIISGRITSSSEEGERIQVNVSDRGLSTQDWLVGSSSSLTMRRLSFVVKGQMNSRRSAFIHSTSTLSVTNCSVSFESGALTDGKIGYSIIDMTGGNLIVDGFVMESSLIMNGKSPISMTAGVKMEILNSRVSGVEITGGDGGCLNVEIKEGGSAKVEECNLSSVCTGGGGMKGGGMMISVGKGGSLEMKNVKYSLCEVPREDVEEGGRGIGGGMFVELPEEFELFVLEGMKFEGCNAWNGKNVFVSGWNLREIVNKEHLKWEMDSEELGSLDELCGWERKTTGEDGYVIPLVVYLWNNWSGNGFVSKEKGGDFSGCGYSESPCSSIDHLISLRYEPLGEGESHVKIVGSGLLQKSISFLSSSSSSKTPIVSIEGEKEGTNLKVSEGGRNEGEGGEGGMIRSNVSLSFTNISFSLPNGLGEHSSLIQSLSSSSASLSILRCSFVCEDSTKETKYSLAIADGGDVVIKDCTLSQFNLAKGFLEFASEVEVIDVMNVSASNTTISGRSLISLIQPSATNMLINKAKENAKQRVRVNSSSFVNITCLENRASVMSVGSFSSGMECVIEGCVLTKCMSERSTEGGGMKMLMKRRESEVKVSGCSFGMCVCSTGNGRGGGMMIDALDPNGECSNTEMPPLGLRLESIRFVMNDAFAGKDVFIRCDSIELQLNERLFGLDFSQEALKGEKSMCGSDGEGKVDVDLIPLITFYYSSQVFVCVNGSDSRQCGAQSNPCESVGNAVQHIGRSVVNMILIDGEGMMGEGCVIGDVKVVSIRREKATIHFCGKMGERGEERSMMVFVNECVVERCQFVFGEMFGWGGESIVKEKDGRLEISECIFSSSTMDLVMERMILDVESGELKMSETLFSGIHSAVPLLSFCGESCVSIAETRILNIECEGEVVRVGGKAKAEMKEVKFENMSVAITGSVMKMDGAERELSVLNCSFAKCRSTNKKGRVMRICECVDVRIGSCLFDGEEGEEGEEREGKDGNEDNGRGEEICRWDGSVVDVVKSSVLMKDTTITNSPEGGISLSGGEMTINDGRFENNNPSIEGYPSLRRNIICSDSGTLNVMSLKGGDGVFPNTSLWMLNDGCNFEGIVSERDSSFFIPVLESVEAKELTDRMKLTFKGLLLFPCNLSFSVVKRKGEEKEIEQHDFDSNGFLSEKEVEGSVEKDLISSCDDEIEVSVHILFGGSDDSSTTESFILKNKSDGKTNEEGKLVEGGKEGKSYWLLVVIVLVVMFLIVLIISVVVTIRWRKQKRRAEELEVIVNDNIRKDPKALEMVTMEISPEEQWRRAEREAEKKNEERIKKRMNENEMVHSESEEYLLSESNSTEYILGRDSDKIPEWALEKEGEEEIRKKTPSPSISSTSTTDTDTTFVRCEDLCPTTSSMSNLVDAMACSSPHEKLIVDLRDSLFMLLHGKNEKKEMEIGSLQQREQTAAQILFWVANGALHSFDEMENPLQSLSNLSPHIVLFSEHMVICIAMHSDLLSDDDSDSSSISSSTVVTSVSDDDDDESDSLPSSAFEDEDSFKKECLRWKAPELLMNKNMGATKESVSFSIGMMLWECLTLQIPFGEYEAEVAEQKIANGERPALEVVQCSSFFVLVKNCVSQSPGARPSLVQLKREFIGRFPPGAAVLTLTDAVDLEDSTGGRGQGTTSFAFSASSTASEAQPIVITKN